MTSTGGKGRGTISERKRTYFQKSRISGGGQGSSTNVILSEPILLDGIVDVLWYFDVLKDGFISFFAASFSLN